MMLLSLVLILPIPQNVAKFFSWFQKPVCTLCIRSILLNWPGLSFSSFLYSIFFRKFPKSLLLTNLTFFSFWLFRLVTNPVMSPSRQDLYWVEYDFRYVPNSAINATSMTCGGWTNAENTLEEFNGFFIIYLQSYHLYQWHCKGFWLMAANSNFLTNSSKICIDCP